MLSGPFVCIDTETTGLSPSNDRVIEIGLIRFEGGVEVARFHSLIDPQVPLDPIITRITGLRDEDLFGSPKFEDVAEQLRSLIFGAVFVAHNADFDYGFIQNEFLRIGETLFRPRLCTVRLSRAIFPEHVRHDLSSIIARYNFPRANRHRALSDAENVWRLLQYMKENVEEEKFRSAIVRLMIE